MDYHQRQALKKNISIGAICVFAGGVAWWVVLAAGLGWVSPTIAHHEANKAAQARVDRVLAPFCADRFLTNKTALAKFIKAGAGYDRNEVVQNAIPKIGTTSVDYRLSANCATIVEAHLKTTPRTVAQNVAKKT